MISEPSSSNGGLPAGDRPLGDGAAAEDDLAANEGGGGGSVGREEAVADVSEKTWEVALLERPPRDGGAEALYVYRNTFNLLPRTIGRLGRLKTLKFFANEVEVLPPEAEGLVELQRLQVKVSSPRISGIPFRKLKSLKELELCKVPLRLSAFSILSEISGLKCLTKLSVCHFSISISMGPKRAAIAPAPTEKDKEADEKKEEEEEEEEEEDELPAPNGWIKRKVASKCDGKQIIRNTFISPDGYLFKSRNQLRRYLEAHPGPPLLAFDWRTIENPIGVVRHKNDFNGFKYLLNSIPAGVIDIPISVTLPLQRKIYKYGKNHSFQFSEETACRLSTVFQEINDREIDGNSAVVYVRTPRELKKILKFRKRNEIANFKLHIPEDVERGQRLYRLGKKEGFEFDDATAFRLAK